MLRAFSALSGASLVSMTTQVVRGKLAALFLGPAGVGIFNQLALMWNLFQIGGSLGTFNGIVQHSAENLAAEDRLAMRRLLSTMLLLLGAISCLLTLSGVLAAGWLSARLLHDRGANADLVALVLLGIPVAVAGLTYRALLSGARAIRRLAQAQIISDLVALAVFAALIQPLGLRGAVIGFLTAHFLFFVITLMGVRKVLGPGSLLPRVSEFRWSVVRSTLGFGASGLAMIALTNLSLLMVSGMIIDGFGAEANGIFANAWRIASVYLGAVTAAAISYYLPSLARAPDDADMVRQVNATLRFYFYTLPILMAAIMAGGELIVRLILTTAFLPVAGLLLLFVPAELLRIVAETVSMPLLARKRVLPFTLLFLIQVGLFLAIAAVALPRVGVVGAVAAYAVSVAVWACAVVAASRRMFGLRIERHTGAAFLRAALLLIAVGLTCFHLPFGLARLGLCAAFCALWLILVLRDRDARSVVGGLLARLRRAGASPQP